MQDIEPPIWQRLLLPPALNLAELHHVPQAAFGWRDEHLHEFIIGGLLYGAPELAEGTATEDDSRTFEAIDVHLRDFDLSHVPNPRFLYHDDFGDRWLHLVEFEQRIPKDITLKYPACVDGARHRPPEDVGGPPGYVQFLEAWSDPSHEEHKAIRQWAGCAFHPRPPTKPSRPPIAEPAATISSVANKPPQPLSITHIFSGWHSWFDVLRLPNGA